MQAKTRKALSLSPASLFGPLIFRFAGPEDLGLLLLGHALRL